MLRQTTPYMGVPSASWQPCSQRCFKISPTLCTYALHLAADSLPLLVDNSGKLAVVGHWQVCALLSIVDNGSACADAGHP
jgi:hypothetical protein